MSINRINLKEWKHDGDRVKLLYSDGDTLYVSKADYDRAFGPIVSAAKHEVIRDFAKQNGMV